MAQQIASTAVSGSGDWLAFMVQLFSYVLASATQHPNFVHQDLSASEGIVMKANKPNSASDPAHGTLELEPLRSRRVRCQARLGSAYKT